MFPGWFNLSLLTAMGRICGRSSRDSTGPLGTPDHQHHKSPWWCGVCMISLKPVSEDTGQLPRNINFLYRDDLETELRCLFAEPEFNAFQGLLVLFFGHSPSRSATPVQ
jgi:hypothetical protein